MKNKEYWVEQLQLLPHPEGGYYKETYRSSLEVELDDLNCTGKGRRSLCTGIYFLMEKNNFSAFHRIQSDEMWHFYSGDPLIVHMINKEGVYSKQVIGDNIEEGQKLQYVVPANVWFASEVLEGGEYSLVGCTVSFGFDFNDFELATTKLMEEYPEHTNLINRLIR